MAEHRPWTTRKPGECAFPIGDPEAGEEQLSCCAPAEKQSSGSYYCPDHVARMFRKLRVNT